MNRGPISRSLGGLHTQKGRGERIERDREREREREREVALGSEDGRDFKAAFFRVLWLCRRRGRLPFPKYFGAAIQLHA